MSFKIFDYQCPACGHVSEDVIVYENTSVFCPECDMLMHRQLAAPGMVKTNHADKTGFRNRERKDGRV